MKKLLCVLGFHNWVYGWKQSKQPHSLRYCQDCKKEQQHLFKWTTNPPPITRHEQRK